MKSWIQIGSHAFERQKPPVHLQKPPFKYNMTHLLLEMKSWIQIGIRAPYTEQAATQMNES